MGLGPVGAAVYLLGDTRDELGGSEWAHHVHGHLGGPPPAVDLPAERALATVLIEGSRERVISAAHDVSDGGVAQALAEMALRTGLGAHIDVPDAVDPFILLLSESAARAIITTVDEPAFLERCAANGVTVTRLGVVTDDDTLRVAGEFAVTLGELRDAHEATLPRLFAE